MTDANPRAQVETLRQRLDSGERYVQFERDRELLLTMSDHIFLIPSKVGDHRHLKILRHNARMAALAPYPKASDFETEPGDHRFTDEEIDNLLEEHGLLGLALEEKGAAQAIVRWIHSEYTNEYTNQDYRTALRSFGRYVLQVEEPPEPLDWIPTGTSNNHDPVPSERDLLLWERDAQPMIEATRNPRDAALIALQFECGLRSGELFDLTVGDVFDAEHSKAIHVDGKMGQKTVHLIVSVPYLQRWLRDPQSPNSDSAPLWSKLGQNERASYNTWLDYFKNAADRAGVDKKATPTNFRKSNMRWLVIRGMSQPEIEDRQGRKRGSEKTAHYMARFGEDSLEKRYAAVHGEDVQIEDEGGEVAPVTCPRCEQQTPREFDFCLHCDQALDVEAKQLVDSVIEAFDEKMVEEDDPETRADLVQARRSVRDNPTMMDKDELHQLVSSVSDDDD